MKQINTTLFLVLLTLIFACSRTENETTIFKDLPLYEEEGSGEEGELRQLDQPRLLATVLKETYLRTTPFDNTSDRKLSPGERVRILGDSTYSPESKQTFLKIQNQYKEIGWIEMDYVIKDTKLGVVVKPTKLFSKPDIFSLRDESAEYGDVLLVKKNKKDGWYSIIKNDAPVDFWVNDLSFVSFNHQDVELATLRRNIFLNLPNPAALFQLKQAVDCTYFNNSIFYQELVDTLYKYEPDTLIVE